MATTPTTRPPSAPRQAAALRAEASLLRQSALCLVQEANTLCFDAHALDQQDIAARAALIAGLHMTPAGAEPAARH